uniref:Uncharacterized protein n=1 Tax=Mola mola TaxID=94237 RepID=A0A3Q4BM00_MOLML
MIQSSQPISLKLTWSLRRWRGGGARRIRRWVNRYSSCFLLLPNAKKNAFSLLVLPGRAKPSARRSTDRPPRCSRASSSKQSCWFRRFLEPLKTLHVSNTSHLLLKPSRSSRLLVCSRAGCCLPEAQVYRRRQGDTPPPGPSEALWGSGSRFLRMRSSAPRSPSRSRDWGPRSSARTRKRTTHPGRFQQKSPSSEQPVRERTVTSAPSQADHGGPEPPWTGTSPEMRGWRDEDEGMNR